MNNQVDYLVVPGACMGQAAGTWVLAAFQGNRQRMLYAGTFEQCWRHLRRLGLREYGR